MKQLTLVALTLGLLTRASNFAWGYEVETHEDMSQKAVEASVLGNDPNVLTSLGLRPLAAKQKFPNSKNSDQDIVNLVRDGARFEDGFSCDDSRPRHHFYNPLTGSGLQWLFNGEPSPDWALEDVRSIEEQAFSYRDTRRNFYQGLTRATEEERKRHLGLTFQGLGHIIHHLQDMAQPEHVRNECTSLQAGVPRVPTTVPRQGDPHEA